MEHSYPAPRVAIRTAYVIACSPAAATSVNKGSCEDTLVEPSYWSVTRSRPSAWTLTRVGRVTGIATAQNGTQLNVYAERTGQQVDRRQRQKEHRQRESKADG